LAAADLPVKAKAVEYVKICTAYGAGFFYIPGSDTCIKIGGYMRADVTFNGVQRPIEASGGRNEEAQLLPQVGPPRNVRRRLRKRRANPRLARRNTVRWVSIRSKRDERWSTPSRRLADVI
jgi:hypothetical protein